MINRRTAEINGERREGRPGAGPEVFIALPFQSPKKEKKVSITTTHSPLRNAPGRRPISTLLQTPPRRPLNSVTVLCTTLKGLLAHPSAREVVGLVLQDPGW
jgi:hypothetical protein